MRLPAALGVIWRHTAVDPSLTELGRVAVPFFAALAAFMAYRAAVRKPEQSLARYAGGRAMRLLAPFAIWSLIYAEIRATVANYTEVVTPLSYPLDLPLAGFAHHLWFLPFVFFVAMGANLCGRVGTRRPALVRGLGVLAVVGAIALSVLIDSGGHPCPDWYVGDRWLLAGPSALIGLAYAVTWFHAPAWRLSPSLGYLAPMLVCMGLMVANAGEPNMALRTAAGGFLLLSALSPRSPAILTRWKIPNELAYGIYMCHVLFVEGSQDVLNILFGLGDADVVLPVFLFSCVASVAFVLVAKRLRLRVLYGG